MIMKEFDGKTWWKKQNAGNRIHVAPSKVAIKMNVNQ